MPLVALPGGRKPDPRRDALRSQLRVRHLRLAALDDLRASIVDEICKLEEQARALKVAARAQRLVVDTPAEDKGAR